MAPKLPLDPDRLQNSEIWQICKRHPFVTRGAINLWISANAAKPLGKLKDDEYALANMADVDIEDFRRHRDLFLHGFVPDGKGNLIHPVVIEVSAARPRHRRKAEAYSEAFEAIWAAFECGDNCPGASKVLAWEAFKAIAEPKPTAPQFRGLVQTYLSQCRAKQRSICHPATFFNQRRWEGLALGPFVDAAEREARAMAAWGGLAKPLVEEIGVPKFMAWFEGSTVRKGPPFTIRVRKEFAKRHIEEKFASQIAAKFGRFKVEVVHKSA